MQKRSVTRRGFWAPAALLAATLGAPSILRAKSYARHPVRLFVGTAAAGSNDLVARLIAQPLSDMLGQPVAVENRPGGATTMSVGLVGNARPDGHTLLVSSLAAVATYIASATKPPNLVDDLSPIGMICDGSVHLRVHKDVSAKSTAEFIALLKSEPRQGPFWRHWNRRGNPSLRCAFPTEDGHGNDCDPVCQCRNASYRASRQPDAARHRWCRSLGATSQVGRPATAVRGRIRENRPVSGRADRRGGRRQRAGWHQQLVRAARTRRTLIRRSQQI